jgi:hypothetical protein
MMKWVRFKGNMYYFDPDKSKITDFIYFEKARENSKIREWLEWGTFGKSGKEPLRFVLLKNMSDEHIQACLKTQPPKYLGKFYTKAFQGELRLRRYHPEFSLKETK